MQRLLPTLLFFERICKLFVRPLWHGHWQWQWQGRIILVWWRFEPGTSREWRRSLQKGSLLGDWTTDQSGGRRNDYNET
jgi:hypothetical protein